MHGMSLQRRSAEETAVMSTIASREMAADSLAGRRIAGAVVTALPVADRPADTAEAEAIRDLVHVRLASSRFGGRIGWKIGCTTSVMQTYLGIGEPCAAGLFEGTRHASPAALPASGFRRIGVECEIAIRLAAPLDARGAALRREDVAAAVAGAAAAIEIVDDRYDDWRSLGAPTLIADDFFAAGHVLGPEVPASELGDLAAAAGVTIVNGVEAGRGVGADVLGHPFEAVLWLAGHLATLGRRIEAGETVLTGSLVETRWLKAGDTARIAIEGLGEVELAVTG